MSADPQPAEVASVGALQRLKWLVGLRLLLASALLGSAFILELHERLPFGTGPLYGLLALTFGLSLLYALLLRSQRHLFWQAAAQLGLDLALISLFIHYTGGIDSVFPFLYILVIFAAASVASRKGCLTVAGFSGLLYATEIFAEQTGLIAPVPFAGALTSLRSTGYVVYQTLSHMVAFLTVAILSSQLTERLRRTGQELERRGIDLQNLRTLHEVIVANISTGLLTLDLAGRVVSFNQAAERITGYTLAALRDRPWRETPFGPCPGLHRFFADRSLAALASPLEELTIQRADGQLLPAEISYSPLHGSAGEMLGLVVMVQDLTERKRIEEALRRADRLAALGRLAATIAHEIRNPLAAISGSVEVLRHDLVPAQGTDELIEIILHETSRLKLITGQFLDFSKPQSALCRPCRIRAVIEDTLQLLERSPEWHPKLRWTLPPGPDLDVLADADQLRQVVWNLCLNAVQAMPLGGMLSVRATWEPGAGPDWVEVTFTDTGQGIAPQDLPKVFDPFYTTRSSGTGLGLSIARRLVESMGGRIEVESRPDVGTTFRMLLRRVRTAAAVVGESA
jgi:two-component system, NtrC family, sensor histidine kinase PilS